MTLTLSLFITSVVIFICILSSKISGRIGVPTLFVFIVLGMLFGSDGVFKIPFDNYVFAEQICSVALIFIMFYGGFGTRWSEARPVAFKSILLSSVGVVLTAVLTGLFCYFVLRVDFLEGMLIGSVLGSTDAASVFSILRSRKLNLKYGSASMLELESGSNDPFSYMMTIIILSAMSGSASGIEIVGMLVSQLFFGLLIGAAVAFIASRFLNRYQFYGEGFDTIFVFAVAIISYALSSLLGGNGYLSTYLTGIILGNQALKNQKTLVSFFDACTGLMQILLFFLLGLLAFPSRMPAIILPAAVIAVFLTFVARPAAVGLLLAPFKTPLNQYLVVSWAGLRGAASIVFAIMVMVSGSNISIDVFHIVFCVVLFSIIFQGSLLPVLAKKCDMIDENADVMKTFTDYTENTQIQFIQLPIGADHPWVDQKIRDINLHPGTLIAVIKRGEQVVVPKGNTQILAGDTVILGAEGFSDNREILLKEIRITPEHRWCNKKVSEAKFYKNTIIVMIKRGDQVIIPAGNTGIQDQDLVVVYSQRLPAEAVID
nr:potassium/proton antiporter [uncultured Clostridium sp.]